MTELVRPESLALLPGEDRLLEVGHPDRVAVHGHLAELVDDRRSRRVQIPAQERQLDDRRLGLRNPQQPRCDVKVGQRVTCIWATSDAGPLIPGLTGPPHTTTGVIR